MFLIPFLCRLPSLSYDSITWTHVTVREAVLELLREISQSKLSKLCQISQPLLSSIVNNKHEGKIGKRKCEEFGKWYCEYRKSNPVSNVCGAIEQGESAQRSSRSASAGEVSQGGETRLTFHASLEVPQLRQWYHLNPKPSDRLLQTYAELLNQSTIRQERTKVTVKSLRNWWKNERQRERKSSKRAPQETTTTSVNPIRSSDVRLTTACEQSSDEEPMLGIAFSSNDNDDGIIEPLMK